MLTTWCLKYIHCGMTKSSGLIQSVLHIYIVRSCYLLSAICMNSAHHFIGSTVNYRLLLPNWNFMSYVHCLLHPPSSCIPLNTTLLFVFQGLPLRFHIWVHAEFTVPRVSTSFHLAKFFLVFQCGHKWIVHLYWSLIVPQCTMCYIFIINLLFLFWTFIIHKIKRKS